MARSWTDLFTALTRCTKPACNTVVLVSIKRTLSYCCSCLPASAKSTVPVSMNNYASASRESLLQPFSGVLRHEHLHERYTSVALTTRTVHLRCCLYLSADWITKSRLLSHFHHTGDVSLHRILNKFSAASKHVHNSRTVRCTGSKNYKKWSLSRSVQQVVCY